MKSAYVQSTTKQRVEQWAKYIRIFKLHLKKNI